MSAWDDLAKAAAEVARELPPNVIDGIVAALERPDATFAAMFQSIASERARARVIKLAERAAAAQTGPATVAAVLRGARAGWAAGSSREHVELVWTGPNPLASALYRTEQTLLGMIAAAEKHILIVTYAAYKVDSVREALQRAALRGVRVDLVVERGIEQGGPVSIDPLFALLAAGEQRIHAYAWPLDQRPRRENGKPGSLHAKCAAVDDDTLLVSSANLTSAALEVNMELGVIVRGGSAARRVRAHFADLIRGGVLRRVEA